MSPELGTRPCGCPADAVDHVDPEPDWIGNVPIIHGESERPVPGTSHLLYGFPSMPDAYRLCGHPNYLTCPETWGGSVMDLEIRLA